MKLEPPAVGLDPVASPALSPLPVPGAGRAARLLALLLVGAVGGCGSTASVQRTDGTVVEAKVLGSDTEGLQLEGESGQHYRMDGRAIVDVDHPGNVAMVAGALLLGEVALLMTSSGFRNELVDGPHGDATMGARPVTALFGLPGALLFGHGLYRYASSRSAAHAFERSLQDAGERPLPSSPPLLMPGRVQ